LFKELDDALLSLDNQQMASNAAEVTPRALVMNMQSPSRIESGHDSDRDNQRVSSEFMKEAKYDDS